MSADIYATKLNEILNLSITTTAVIDNNILKENLLSAIHYYKMKIEDLKKIVLLSDNCELSNIYKSGNLLIKRIEHFWDDYATNQIKFDKINPKLFELNNEFKLSIEKFEHLEKEIGIIELQEQLSVYESNVLAAQVLDDKKSLLSALNKYFEFISIQIKQNPEYLSTIIQKSDSHQTCLDSIEFLTSEFEALLKKISFPIIISDVLEEGNNRTWCDDDLQTFSNYFQILSTLNIAYLNIILSKPITDLICLPIQIVLNPLEKRFRYHFCGTRKTNRPDKPEWYMSQILQWIRVNDYFITVVGRDFVGCSSPAHNLRIEFIRGLTMLILDKLNTDLGLADSHSMRFTTRFLLKSDSDQTNENLKQSVFTNNNNEILNNTECFGHLIDVVLQTDARLTQLGYPLNQPRPSDVLSNPKVFSRWLLLEQRLAFDRLKDLLSKPISWTVVDETQKRPQCVDDFIALSHSINLRGKQLTNKLSRTRFVQIQLNLIREFFSQLVLLARTKTKALENTNTNNKSLKNELETNKQTIFHSLFSSHNRSSIKTTSISTSPVGMKKISLINQLFNCFVDGFEQTQSSNWINILNALKHVHETLLEWANDQYYVTFWEESTTRNLLQHGDPWLIDIGLCALENEEINQKLDKNPVHDQTATDGLHGGVFTQVLNLYSEQIDEMLEETVRLAFGDIKQKSSNYINSTEDWLRIITTTSSGHSGGYNLGSNLNMYINNLTLSSNATIILLTLRNWLFNLSRSLHPKLFTRVWQRLASSMDNYLYNELILSNRFTVIGAAQLRFDLNNCLYPMFALYTNRPESYFILTRDACVLLNLLRGTAELLKQTLEELINSNHTSQSINNQPTPLAPLLELGVYGLTAEEAIHILSLRVNSD